MVVVCGAAVAATASPATTGVERVLNVRHGRGALGVEGRGVGRLLLKQKKRSAVVAERLKHKTKQGVAV